MKLCESKDMKLEPFFDSRKASARTTPLRDIVRALEDRRIQALIATDITIDEARWIGKLPIPTSVFVEAEYPTKVDFDFDQFIQLGLKKLKAAGCRSVGLISLRGPWKPSVEADQVNARPEFAGRFSSFCREKDILTSDHWIKTAEEFVEGKGPQEGFGYTQFQRIWQLPQRPEGLIVYPNSCSVGVIMGVLEKRVNVPDELKLVFHKHRELDYLCPLPVSYLYSSTAEVAKTLLQQVVQQFDGEPVTSVTIPFRADPDVVAAKRGRKMAGAA